MIPLVARRTGRAADAAWWVKAPSRATVHADSVTALAMFPGGLLASGSADRSIRLWDVKVCAETARLEGGDHPVSALALLADGRLASGCSDGTIRIWDATSLDRALGPGR